MQNIAPLTEIVLYEIPMIPNPQQLVTTINDKPYERRL